MLKERLITFLTQTSMKQSEFALKSGVNPVSVNTWIHGNQNLGTENLRRIEITLIEEQKRIKNYLEEALD